MGDRLTGRHLACLLIVGLGAGGCAAPEPLAGGRVLEYALALTLHADGRLTVEERARVQFDGSGGVFRLPIPDWRVDAVGHHAATVDGAATGGADVPGRPGGGLRWEDAGGGGIHEFRQTYDAIGVLEYQGARGQLIWPAVPARMPVDRADVTVRWPADAVPATAPVVDGGRWQLTQTGAAATFSATDVAADADPWLYVDLVLDDLSAAEPAWQIRERRARQLTPAFVAAGLFLAVVGAGIAIMLRVRYPAGVPAGEWRDVRRGLTGAGAAILAAAGVVTAVVPVVAGGLGRPPYAVPAGLAVLGLTLVARGLTFRKAREAGVLHSPRLRQDREP